MNILFISSEMAPLLSTGGLADVANALPKALKKLGHDVRVVLPLHGKIAGEYRGEERCLCVAELQGKTEYGAMREARVPGTDIPLYLIEHNGYFDRPDPYSYGGSEYDDNVERFSFFCLAALHGVEQTGWKPDVVHCHDWHTAILPALLKTRFAQHPFWGGIPSVYTIHNLAYQGRYGGERFAQTGLSEEVFHGEGFEFHGDLNLMKGALHFADRLNTVSPRYAREIQTIDYGEGLDGTLQARSAHLSGILNGVDYETWDPSTDPHIPKAYSREDLRGKAECKAALQAAFSLPIKDVPLFAVVSRLTDQKGIDLIVHGLEQLVQQDMQLVVLGTGYAALEQQLRDATNRYPEHVSAAIRFDVGLSHQIYAGADFFLMPSRFEPCGLSQLYSLAYGTIPVVRRTGGLADSVQHYNAVNQHHSRATGIVFAPQTTGAIVRAVHEACVLYKNMKQLDVVRQQAMAADFSWDRSCAAYLELYKEAGAA